MIIIVKLIVCYHFIDYHDNCQQSYSLLPWVIIVNHHGNNQWFINRDKLIIQPFITADSEPSYSGDHYQWLSVDNKAYGGYLSL